MDWHFALGQDRSGVVVGATVHLVDADYDTGPILAQREVPIHSDGTAEDIERRVMAAEPGLFVETLVRLASGGLALPPGEEVGAPRP